MALAVIQQQIRDASRIQITGRETNEAGYLSMAAYAGVVEYYPAELVITVKAGTRLQVLQKLLAAEGQAVPFPITDDEGATIGGAYAAGGNALLRDAILGIKIIDGESRLLTFGGQVMKNVAGYDVARLLVGSQGKLAVMYEMSFKVLPMAYIGEQKQAENRTVAASSVRNRIEAGLKQVFDPRGVFI